jgi:putative methionine-R-sulfoxide reductase with GAF domain
VSGESQESLRQDGPGAGQQTGPAADQADAAYARRLRDALGGLGMLGTLAVPHTHNQLLVLLVRNAIQVTGAKAGTLRLLDQATNELVFEVIEGTALPPSAVEAARQFRVPLGQGIAGWVAASGQAIVRSDLAADPRFAAEASQRIGYVPNSMLCLPLQGPDGILGVIELFDKMDGTAFTAADMGTLGLFGEAAAAAIAQSQVLNDLTRLFGVMLQRLLSDTPDAVLLQDHAPELVARVVAASDYRDAIQIALTAGQIARQGPDARRFCLQVLDHFADYLRGQHNRATLGGRLP